MESTKILMNGRRLPTPILFGLNFPAVVQIQLTELNSNLMNGKIDKRELFSEDNLPSSFSKITCGIRCGIIGP
ncbi:hypothetical protein CEXT_273421 [Caerostris extrusa]|uniref:Uncharacterized protein n=1 Tax=Caerostris extrusa TaxID=172846 RepID=A0AAV4USB3_CAEEX|nr:hypothetical protein CEXT_273421 [Caerostris extrusa]